MLEVHKSSDETWETLILTASQRDLSNTRSARTEAHGNRENQAFYLTISTPCCSEPLQTLLGPDRIQDTWSSADQHTLMTW